ncbi:hypothetical protein C8F04DRAFT_1185413 [Mycena alexandri]|uniref:Uncharacterized protein n=1 Tax=Mycena alexandri TaxID=1745969 RepID=A0AAD6X4L0_9AGAR|nr:hypothetical protein C8F04DRAFT_1185413 [Mycena alexandri]
MACNLHRDRGTEEQLEAFDRVHSANISGAPSKVDYMLDGQERDLPPLPDDPEGISNNRHTATPSSLPIALKKPRSELYPPSPVTPSTHAIVFPARSSSLRPKLLVETGSGSLRLPGHLHSIDGVSTASAKFSSWKASRSDTTLPNELSYPSPDDEELSEPYRHISPFRPAVSKSPSKKSSLANCRFLNAVRLPKLPDIVLTKAVTTRAVGQKNNSDIIARPFMRSDGNPLHGITVTVHRQQLVSEPEFWSSSTTSLPTSGSVLSLDKPLPTPVEDLIQDDDDLQLPTADPLAVAQTGSLTASDSKPPTSATLYVAHRPKRRKRYRSAPHV